MVRPWIALLLALRRCLHAVRLCRFDRRTEPADESIRVIVRRLQERFGAGWNVRVRQSPSLLGPVAYGAWFPTITVPNDLLERFDDAQITVRASDATLDTESVWVTPHLVETGSNALSI